MGGGGGGHPGGGGMAGPRGRYDWVAVGGGEGAGTAFVRKNVYDETEQDGGTQTL